MFSKVHVFSRSSTNLQNILQGIPRCQVHYQIGKNGQKIVVSQRHRVKQDREKWQKVEPMGFEAEVREISRIERNDRLHSDSRMAKMTAWSKMNQLKARLESAGFCRDRKSYTPPSDVDSKMDTISQTILNTNDRTFSLSNAEHKFNLLTACAAEFDHEVSNSIIHQMRTINDVIEFYQTPVRGANSYDHMANQSSSLPKNLHIIPEPIRFNPETDTFFGGVDAFPGSTNDIVGLRAKKRYEKKQSRFEWPDI